jgi:hypothetical protein
MVAPGMYKSGGNMQYDAFGNFNYGAVGAALGIPLSVLQHAGHIELRMDSNIRPRGVRCSLASIRWHGLRSVQDESVSQQYSEWQMKDFLYFLAAFVVFIAVVKLVFDVRMRKHHGVSRDEFLRAFSDTEIPAEIPAAVYDYYKKMVNFKEFSVAPDDTYEMLHKGEEDIEDDARFLMKKLKLRPPSEEVPLQWTEQTQTARATSLSAPRFSVDSTRWMQSIQTVRDMVLWLNFVRQHQEVTVPGR